MSKDGQYFAASGTFTTVTRCTLKCDRWCHSVAGLKRFCVGHPQDDRQRSGPNRSLIRFHHRRRGIYCHILSRPVLYRHTIHPFLRGNTAHCTENSIVWKRCFISKQDVSDVA